MGLTNGATETRRVFGIGSYCLYFESDTSIRISLVGKKIHHLGFGFTNAKKKSLFFFTSNKFGVVHSVQFGGSVDGDGVHV